MYIIGLDIGTTSVCGICCEKDTGHIVDVITMPNQSNLYTQHSWERVQDAEKLACDLESICNQLVDKWKEIYSIGVTGQMHGIVYIDSMGKAVSPLYTWQDGRGDLPFKDGQSYAEWLQGVTGYSLSTGYGMVTHFYNMTNQLVPKDAAYVCTIHDYAVMKLTQRSTPIFHSSDAASLGIYNLCENQFDLAKVSKAGLDVTLFAEVERGYSVAGYTSRGIPVGVAIGDNQASILGALTDLERSVLVNVGTGSQVSCVVKHVPEKCDIECRPLVEDMYLLAGSSLCGGRAYAILERFLRETAEAISGVKVEHAYSAMERVVRESCMEKNTLLVNTEFSGTRQEPDRRGFIQNINIENFTMANLCDGVMKGIVRELYDMYLQMLPYLEQEPAVLVGSGNGIRMNAYLADCFAEKFGMELHIPQFQEEAAYGAAVYGSIAAKG